ncbi:MAG: anaerobic sulfatase-maturation protein [Paludibacteraceae bacterium]
MQLSQKSILFNPLSMPTYVMAKPVGSICNLDCSYCYYLEKENVYPHRKSYQMSDETLEKYIESYIQSQPVPEVLFIWHGGEPLLRDISFYRKALALQKKYGRGRLIDNSLQTNGVLLNEEWCRFFKENNFLIGISIDGTEHCHDFYRKNKGGIGTFKQVMRGIYLLQKYEVPFNTLSVINDYTVDYPLEIYRFFKEIDSRYMQFTPVVERVRIQNEPSDLRLMSPEAHNECILAPWVVDPKKFGVFYVKIFEEWVRNDVGRYFVQLFNATLANTIGQQPGTCIFSKTCGHASAMEFDGDVYACDHYVFPQYKLGNIKTQTVFEMMFSEKQKRFGADKHDLLPMQCRECRFVKLCNGECPKNRISYTADGEPGLNYLCEGYKMYYEYTQPYMEFMANELYAKRSPANVMFWKI